MRETNRILDGRTQRLRQEYEAAGARNDQLSMDAIESDMDDWTHLRYSIWALLGDGALDAVASIVLGFFDLLKWNE